MVARQDPRFPALFAGTMVYRNWPHAITQSVDLSRRGCRLKSSTAAVEPGAKVDLLLYMPDDDVPLLIRRATVRWSSSHGIGLEFQPLPTPHQARLDRVLRQLEIAANN